MARRPLCADKRAASDRSERLTIRPLLGGLVLLSAACTQVEQKPAGSAPVASAAPNPLRATGAATGWEGGKWGTFHSQRFDVRLPLPDGRTWRIDDHKGSWLSATHAPSASTVRLRMFLESHAQNRAKCEARVREADAALPKPKPDQSVDDAEAGVLAGWDARAISFVTPDPAVPQKLTGHLLVFASNIRKCLAFQLTTEASGPAAQEIVAARLVDAKERIVRDLRFDQDLGAPGREVLTAPGPAAPTRLPRRGRGSHRRDPAGGLLVAPEFQALPGARLELDAGRAAHVVDATEASSLRAIEVHAGAFVERERALVEMTVDGGVGQIVAASAAPTKQIFGGDEDVALAALAASATTGTVEGRSRVGVDGRLDLTRQVGIERGGCQEDLHPRRGAPRCQFQVSQNPRTCE